MEYNIKLDMRLPPMALQQLINTLDAGPHGLVRPLIDIIIAQAQEQDKAAQAATPPAPVAPVVPPETPAPVAPPETPESPI